MDLREVQYLETIQHHGPSSIGLDTIYRSQGEIPESFLRGAGISDLFITYMRSLVYQPIIFASCFIGRATLSGGQLKKIHKNELTISGLHQLMWLCRFISYSSKDGTFAKKLHACLQKSGVRCWFAPHDLQPGNYFRERIDQAVQAHDKLLLILSEHSVASGWVRYEVELALSRENSQQREILFPLRLDDAVLCSTTGWAASLQATRHIGDFTRWKDDDGFQQAFSSLLRALKAGS